MNALTLLLLAAATYRITRLVGTDTITEPLRDRLNAAAVTGLRALDTHRPPTKRAQAAAWLSELVACPWCLSIWVGAAVAAAWWAAVGTAAPALWVPAVALTCSAFTGIVSQAVGMMDRGDD